MAKFFPIEKIRQIWEQTQRASVRERDLPAHVVVYYVIELALYMRSSYREVLRCLLEACNGFWTPRPDQSGRQIGHLPSAESAGSGAHENTVCRRGGADSGEAHVRRLVSTVASAVKRKMSNYNLRPRQRGRTRRIEFAERVRLIK